MCKRKPFVMNNCKNSFCKDNFQNYLKLIWLIFTRTVTPLEIFRWFPQIVFLLTLFDYINIQLLISQSVCQIQGVELASPLRMLLPGETKSCPALLLLAVVFSPANIFLCKVTTISDKTLQFLELETEFVQLTSQN